MSDKNGSSPQKTDLIESFKGIAQYHIRFVAAVALLLPGSWALGAPAVWPINSGGNGHAYDFIADPNITWNNANTAAAVLTLNGIQGHLTTDTSTAENTFLQTTFGNGNNTAPAGWLGGYQDTLAPDYSEPAGGWRWITGEPWNYTNWFSGNPTQPDNFGGSQNFLRAGGDFSWDDLEQDPSNPSVVNIFGFYVEYNTPEPASLGMLVLAGLPLVLRRYRRKIKISH